MYEIMSKLAEGTQLETPSKRRPFKILRIDSSGVVVEVGASKTPIPIPANCLNGIPDFLRGKGWVEIGATHQPPAPPRGSLDEYLQDYTRNISVASYVVPILERILLVEVDRTSPAKVRLSNRAHG